MIIIDRIEGELAICENGEERINIPLKLIDYEPKEGDALIPLGEGFTLDRAATADRRDRISALQDDIFS